ncbi:hypothetical protein [Chloroflexus sp.]|uniref:hypothetical protein n=1 Tax=Chloroflexus sp. TaxID=1904827 RepID=UPI0026121EA7|nr:hypothetical protein [uncultured Chloroflexus sp.]
MNLREHLITSTLLAAGLYLRRPQAAALLITGGVLIDLDHLILYACRTGDWSISGALSYNRYRNRLPWRGDNRPRYGSLRSWLHQPLLVLPPLWTLTQRWPRLRPFAIGVTLHLLLDHVSLPFIWAAYLRSRGRCSHCGSHQHVEVYRRPRRDDHRLGWIALCRRCSDLRVWYTTNDRHTQSIDYRLSA